MKENGTQIQTTSYYIVLTFRSMLTILIKTRFGRRETIKTEKKLIQSYFKYNPLIGKKKTNTSNL